MLAGSDPTSCQPHNTRKNKPTAVHTVPPEDAQTSARNVERLLI
jgi:hypothetical protein